MTAPKVVRSGPGRGEAATGSEPLAHSSVAGPTEPCPHCGTELRGWRIPDEHFLHRQDCPLPEGDKYFPGRCFCLPYGDLPPEKRYGSRMIGYEVPGVYDGVLFWGCPDCGGRWHRWPAGSELYDIAATYIAGVPGALG